MTSLPHSAPSEPPAFLSAQVTAARRFYLNLNPAPAPEITVVCGGWEECAPDYAIDRKTFRFPSIEFVAAGTGELTLDGARHELTAGTVFSYGPDISQRIKSHPAAPLQKYFVNFTGERALTLLDEVGLPPGTLTRLHSPHEVRSAFESLVRFGTRHDRHTDRACTLQLELLLLAIDRSNQPASVSARRAHATFERCRAYLDLHFRTLATLDQAASACHLDPAYLCRIFARFLGESPYRYLQRLQMQWAAERLHSQGKLIREVAAELQIDPFQFSRTFKRVHGVSPSEFLKTSH